MTTLTLKYFALITFANSYLTAVKILRYEARELGQNYVLSAIFAAFLAPDEG